MRFVFTLLFLLSFGFVSAQLSTEFGGGINSKSIPAISIEMSYRFPKLNIGAGYIVPLTDKICEPDIFFARLGKTITITSKSGIDLGGGLAVHTTKQLTVSKLDDQYSYYRKNNQARLLLYADYRKKILKDGEVFTRTVYTGQTFFLGVGVAYIFTKKKC